MRLGIRLLFAFFLINGIAAFFVLRVFTAEIKPSVREVMEDMMVDTANLLAELASDDLAAGRLAQGDTDSAFARHVRNYVRRPIDAGIWGFAKQSLDYRIYVTDATGRVLFDSQGQAVGQDFSQWRDVARTLRGEYGARMTREVPSDDTSGVMHVAAPVLVQGRILGVLTVAKPVRTVQRFIDRAERKVLMGGLVLLLLSAAVGVAVTLWMVWNVRRLRDYALSVQGPADGEHDTLPATALAVPRVPGELGDLARAMDRMRTRLQGHDYIEGYVRALTHELKRPVAAIRGAGELVLLLLSAAVGVAVTLWMVWNVRRLRDYALSVQGPADGEHDTLPATALAVPRVPGELGDLARAMDRMRTRLQGHDYIEGYVRALTHELKSPVAAIRGAGELLQEDLPAADRAQFATQVVQQSERLQRLIDRLLELSKLEQRQHTEVRSPVSLHDCASAALASSQARAMQRGLQLTLSGAGASGPWEAELVTMALTNLLDNAMDFSPAGSIIRIELDGTNVAVQDSGPGVPDYALPRLGERFFTTARPGGERSGSGLGLAIVRRVMALHGGHLAVRNTQPGLRVVLEFPAG